MMTASSKFSRRGMQCLRDAGAAAGASERARLLEASQRWFDLASQQRDLDDQAAAAPPVTDASGGGHRPLAGRDPSGKTSH